MDFENIYNSSVKEKVKELFEYNYLESKELHSVTISNGVILPITGNKSWKTGVIDCNGEYVNESSELGIYDEGNETEKKCVLEGLELVTYDCNAVYIGAFNTSHWGQFFAMDISRLWYVIKNFNELKNFKFAYCGNPTYKENTFGFSSKNAYELLGVLGIKKEQLIDIRLPSQFNKIIIPQKSFKLWQYFTKEYRLIYDTIAANITLEMETYNKIYFTRRKLNKKKEVGENVFEQFFQRNGYKVIAPERLSFKEQVWLMKNCDSLASIEGTLAYNSLFAKKKMDQIVLRKQSEILPTPQFLQVQNIKCQLIDIYKEPFKGFPITHDRGPFLLSFNENIQACAKQNNMNIEGCYDNKIGNLMIYSFHCISYVIIHSMKRFQYLRKLWRQYQLRKI